MKKQLVKISGDVRIVAGQVELLAGTDNTLLKQGFQKIFIGGELTDPNGTELEVRWDLCKNLLDSGVTLRGVKSIPSGWCVYLNCDETLKVKTTTPIVEGNVIEPILLRAIRDNTTSSGARLL